MRPIIRSHDDNGILGVAHGAIGRSVLPLRPETPRIPPGPNAVQLRYFFEIFYGVSFWQRLDDTGVLTPASFFNDGELKLSA